MEKLKVKTNEETEIQRQRIWRQKFRDTKFFRTANLKTEIKRHKFRNGK